MRYAYGAALGQISTPRGLSWYYTKQSNIDRATKRGARARDPWLRRTFPAAQRIMKEVRKKPKGDARVRELKDALQSYHPEMHKRFRQVAEHLKQKKGFDSEQAVQTALALTLADATMQKMEDVGYMQRMGMNLPLTGMGLGGGGLGGAKSFFKDFFSGVSCSEDLQKATTAIIEEEKGEDAANYTTVGWETTQAAACQGGDSGSQTPDTEMPDLTRPPPPPAEEKGDEGMPMWVPIVVGVGVLALVGGAVYVASQ